jgi:hypothetical protein
MSRQVNYTGEHIPDGYVAGYDPNLTAQSILLRKQIPDNFVNLSSRSKAYKENVLGQLLLQVQDHDQLLDTMCSFMRSAPDGSTTLQVMTEYAASIAFALEHKDLAIQMITRNEPTQVGPHVWSLVNAIKKGMPGVMYQGLLTSNVHIASAEWEATKEVVINSL